VTGLPSALPRRAPNPGTIIARALGLRTAKLRVCAHPRIHARPTSWERDSCRPSPTISAVSAETFISLCRLLGTFFFFFFFFMGPPPLLSATLGRDTWPRHLAATPSWPTFQRGHEPTTKELV
jgi:hypothetical protein